MVHAVGSLVMKVALVVLCLVLSVDAGRVRFDGELPSGVSSVLANLACSLPDKTTTAKNRPAR